MAPLVLRGLREELRDVRAVDPLRELGQDRVAVGVVQLGGDALVEQLDDLLGGVPDDLASMLPMSHLPSCDWTDVLPAARRQPTPGACGLGAEVRLQPFEILGTARIAALRDPGGANVALWQAVGFPGARLVNEAATWTSNNLSALLVGGMRTMEDDPPDASPAWFPYFVIDDADRAGERVERLGGGIIVPPREVPAGRFLGVRGPAGAVSALFEMGPDGPARGVDRLGR